MSDLKKIWKNGMSQKINATTSDPDQGDDEDALTNIQQHKNCIPKKGPEKLRGGKKDVRFQKKVRKRLKVTRVP